MSSLFSDHLSIITSELESLLVDHPWDGVLFHSGSEQKYYRDDNPVPFIAHAHFMRWVPVERPDQFVLVRPNESPLWFHVQPNDFWEDHSTQVAPEIDSAFDVKLLSHADEVKAQLPQGAFAFIGESEASASALGIAAKDVNPVPLIHALDYQRAFKTEWEIQCMRAATALAVRGHDAAAACFTQGGSELEIHQAFCRGSEQLEKDLSFNTIVGLGRHASILHYQQKEHAPGAGFQNVLVDAGCRHLGYHSDLTRSHLRSSVHPVFFALRERLIKVHDQLVAACKPGACFQELHLQAHQLILGALHDHDVVKGSHDELIDAGVSRIFFPHGLGHLLGLQTHDVGGHLADKQGKLRPPPDAHPFLRLTRTLEERMVVTVEPGIYFIPILLTPALQGEKAHLLNATLIDELIPFGGLRWENDILIAQDGPIDLACA